MNQLEERTAGDGCDQRARHERQGEVEATGGAELHLLLEDAAGVRPFRRDVRECELRVGQLGAQTVDAVKNIDRFLQRRVWRHDLDRQAYILDCPQGVQVLVQALGKFDDRRLFAAGLYRNLERIDLGGVEAIDHAAPHGVAAHPRALVILKVARLQVEI